jgi:hypothetical protein
MKSRPKKSKIITRYFTRFASLISGLIYIGLKSGFDIKKIMVLVLYITERKKNCYSVIIRLLTLIMFMLVWRYSLPSALL